MGNKMKVTVIPNGEGPLPLQNHTSNKKTLQELLRMSDQKLISKHFPSRKLYQYYHEILTKNDNENDY